MPPENDGKVSKGVLAAVMIAMPAMVLETAGAGLLLWWMAGGWPSVAVIGLCLHTGAAWSLWWSAPDKGTSSGTEDDPENLGGEDPEQIRIRSRRYIHALSALIVLFFPVIGLPGVVFMLGYKQISRRKGLVEVVTSEMKRAALAIGVERVEDLDSFLIEEASVEPILEILKGSDVGLKRGAVSLLGSIGGKEAVALLRESLSDASAEVRFYAHATLAKLNDSYAQEIKEAEEKAKPDNAPSWERLGEAFSRYAASGLPEEVVRGQLLEWAALAYSRAVGMAPGDSGLLLKLGRLHLSSGRFGQARQYFQQVPQDDPARPEALLGLCEIAYEMRDHATLAALQGELAGNTLASEDPNRIILYKFWARGGEFA